MFKYVYGSNNNWHLVDEDITTNLGNDKPRSNLIFEHYSNKPPNLKIKNIIRYYIWAAGDKSLRLFDMERHLSLNVDPSFEQLFPCIRRKLLAYQKNYV